MKSIFEYLDYRQYLRDYYEEKKQTTPAFSMRMLAKQIGIRSPSFFKMVIDNQRSLSDAVIEKFTTALKLKSKEAQYFESLVLFNQSKTDKQRELHLSRMIKLRPQIKSADLSKEQYEYFRFRYFVIIREMVALPHFQEDYEWIASSLTPSIRPHEAQHAIQSLIKIGLLKRDKDGKLMQQDASIATLPEVFSIELFNLHREWVKLAQERFPVVPPENRDYSAMTVPVPKSKVKNIKKMIADFRDEILAYLNTGDQEFEEVYQINMQMFPVTETKKTS